jgi:hypothetical protein
MLHGSRDLEVSRSPGAAQVQCNTKSMELLSKFPEIGYSLSSCLLEPVGQSLSGDGWRKKGRDRAGGKERTWLSSTGKPGG